MASANMRGRCRGRPRRGTYTETVDARVIVFGENLDVEDRGFVDTSSSEEDTSNESKEQVSMDNTDSEEKKKKLDQLTYKFMARHLISGLQEHRLDQVMAKYMNLNVGQDAPPAAPPPRSSGSSIVRAKQVASDQPPTSSAISTRPVAVCKTMSNSQPSSQEIIDETAMSPEVALENIIPDIPKKHVYIGRGRGRGFVSDINKRLQGRKI